MKVLVTFAVDAEFAPWRKRRGFRRLAGAPHPVYETEMGESTIRVVLTGMGSESARRAVRVALDDSPTLCIATGLAGGLRPGTAVGDILVAERVGEAQGLRTLESHRELLRIASACGARTAKLFLSSRRLVSRALEKRQMAEFGDAVDLESYAVLTEATRRGVPAVALRAVSDTWEADLPYDFERTLDDRGQVRLGALIAQVVWRPQRLAALVRLGRDSRRAAARLAQFLDLYVESVATQMGALEQELVAAT